MDEISRNSRSAKKRPCLVDPALGGGALAGLLQRQRTTRLPRFPAILPGHMVFREVEGDAHNCPST